MYVLAISFPNTHLTKLIEARVSFQSLRSAEEEDNDYFAEDIQNRNTKLYEPRHQKRARTTSPGKRVMNARRIKHETMKRARMKQELEARKELRDRDLLREVLSNVHQGSAKFNSRPISNFSPPICLQFVCPGNSEQDTPQGTGRNDSETEDAEETDDEHENQVAASVSLIKTGLPR